jgi:hypothetical protein
LFCDPKGQVRVEIHTHLGKFQAHVAIQLVLSDGVQDTMVDIRGLLRLLGGSDILAQAVERGRHAMAVHCLGRTERIVDADTSNEAGRHPSAKTGTFCEVA